MALVRFEDVCFSFGDGFQVMEQLSFHVTQGEVVALVGPSGSGKSTLFRILSGLLEPQRGQIYWGEQPLKAADRLGKVSYVPQQPQLLAWRTAAANAAIGLELAGVSPKEALQQVRPLLNRFGLQEAADRLPSGLSGGMRQRVSLMRAMLYPAPLMLLDEPFSSLDSFTRMRMHDWLLGLWEHEQRTVLLITHDLDEAMLLADRILLITESPMRMLQEVQVPFLRPRTSALELTPEFIALKKQLLNELGVVQA